MANRKGKGEGTPAPDPTQITTHLRAQLQNYSSYVSKINTTLKDVNQIHTEIDGEGKPISLVKGRFDRAYDTVGEQTTEELKRIDAAIESLDLLISIHNTPAPVPPPTPTPVPVAVAPAAASKTPAAANKAPGTGAKRGPYKKRKVDGTPSSAPSPAASSAASPAAPPTPLPSTTTARANSVKPLQPAPSSLLAKQGSPASSPAASGSGGGGGTEKGGKKATTKTRKDALAGQLPLAPGRQVAFRQPVKGGPADQRKEDWILARIVTCIQGDKNRYAVEDVDYDSSNPTPEGGKYNTTLKSIVPLPDKNDPHKTYPDHDYAAGTQVMALYPDTTSFYRAIIQSGPIPLITGTEKGKKSKKEPQDKLYRVKFDDDDDLVREVLIELVVEIP